MISARIILHGTNTDQTPADPMTITVIGDNPRVTLTVGDKVIELSRDDFLAALRTLSCMPEPYQGTLVSRRTERFTL